MKKVYLAGPFFDDEQIERIERVEKALDNNATVSEYFSPRKHQHDDLKFGSPEWQDVVYKGDVQHVEDADVIVAIADFIDDSVDSGTAFEIGYAAAKNKKIVLLHEKDSIVNLMLAQSLTTYIDDFSKLKNLNLDDLPNKKYTGEIV